MPKAVIFAPEGKALLPHERTFFEQNQPLGFILFARNCENPTQLRELTEDLKSTLQHDDIPILIDQEGGRVARLRPPHWKAYKTPHSFYEALLAGEDGAQMARAQAFELGGELAAHGINVNCAPCCDLLFPQTHEIIGDRSFGPDVDTVVELSLETIAGLKEAGVKSIIKHIPGHGRATADSHLELPHVDATYNELREKDFSVFKNIIAKAPDAQNLWAMTAHIVYKDIDPQNPATHSPKVIGDVIRGYMGFEGLLISDDLSMEALTGSLAERAEKSFTAGCDVVLHCNGKFDEMQAIAAVTGSLNRGW